MNQIREIMIKTYFFLISLLIPQLEIVFTWFLKNISFMLSDISKFIAPPMIALTALTTPSITTTAVLSIIRIGLQTEVQYNSN